MPIIEMHLLEGRSAEQKRRVAAAITEAVTQALECRADTVRILITEHGGEEFYVAGQNRIQAAEEAVREQEKTP